jgi:hypothetical protein
MSAEGMLAGQSVLFGYFLIPKTADKTPAEVRKIHESELKHADLPPASTGFGR